MLNNRPQTSQRPCTGTCCGDQCVDLQTDESFCGTCSNSCGTQQQCCSGVCAAADSAICLNSGRPEVCNTDPRQCPEDQRTVRQPGINNDYNCIDAEGGVAQYLEDMKVNRQGERITCYSCADLASREICAEPICRPSCESIR